MTAEELRHQLENELRVVNEYIEIQRRAATRTKPPAVTPRLSNDKHDRNGANANINGAFYGIIGPSVANAIKQCGRNYDLRDIRRRLQKDGKQYSASQIATALRRFEKQGKIKEVKHGSGRRPNKYSTISL